MHRIEGIHHVSVLVMDLERALGFYRDVLGLALDEARPNAGFPGAWLPVGAQQIHLLELPDDNTVAETVKYGGRDRHIALRVSDLAALVTTLERAGIAYTRSGSGRQALFCRDPDGNALEFGSG